MFLQDSAKDDVLRVAVVLDLAFVDLVGQLPGRTGRPLEKQLDVSVVQAVSEESADASTRPAVDLDDVSEPDSIPIGNEDQVVLREQCAQDPCQIFFGEVVLGPPPIDQQAFFGKHPAKPLHYTSLLLYRVTKECTP